jgi:hypothetical protein
MTARQSTPRPRSYSKPAVQRFGTLRELTQARISLGVGDAVLPACADHPAQVDRS